MPNGRLVWTAAAGRIALLALAALGSACSVHRPVAYAPAPSSDVVDIEVSNHSWTRATIYAENDGARVRLGTVAATEVETFRLPASIDPRLGLWLEARSGLAPLSRSGRILVEVGSRVVWSLENQDGLSSYRVVGPR